MKKEKKIASYEDACKELGLSLENLPVVDALPEKDRNSRIAYHKLTIIARALNEGWEPDWSDHGQYKYYGYFYTNAAGFVSAATSHAATYAYAYIGSRLCFKSSETALYAIEQFKSLYEEYLFIK
jgi:hypothetical protein